MPSRNVANVLCLKCGVFIRLTAFVDVCGAFFGTGFKSLGMRVCVNHAAQVMPNESLGSSTKCTPSIVPHRQTLAHHFQATLVHIAGLWHIPCGVAATHTVQRLLPMTFCLSGGTQLWLDGCLRLVWSFQEICSHIQVKQSLYRPGETLRFPGGWGYQILRQSVHEDGKVVCRTHRRPLPPRKCSWVDPRVIVRPEGLCNEKFQWHYQESNPRPRRTSTNCATAYPDLQSYSHQ
jgi:hypothetical protein